MADDNDDFIHIHRSKTTFGSLAQAVAPPAAVPQKKQDDHDDESEGEETANPNVHLASEYMPLGEPDLVSTVGGFAVEHVHGVAKSTQEETATKLYVRTAIMTTEPFLTFERGNLSTQ